MDEVPRQSPLHHNSLSTFCPVCLPRSVPPGCILEKRHGVVYVTAYATAERHTIEKVCALQSEPSSGAEVCGCLQPSGQCHVQGRVIPPIKKEKEQKQMLPRKLIYPLLCTYRQPYSGHSCHKASLAFCSHCARGFCGSEHWEENHASLGCESGVIPLDFFGHWLAPELVLNPTTAVDRVLLLPRRPPPAFNGSLSPVQVYSRKGSVVSSGPVPLVWMEDRTLAALREQFKEYVFIKNARESLVAGHYVYKKALGLLSRAVSSPKEPGSKGEAAQRLVMYVPPTRPVAEKKRQGKEPVQQPQDRARRVPQEATDTPTGTEISYELVDSLVRALRGSRAGRENYLFACPASGARLGLYGDVGVQKLYLLDDVLYMDEDAFAAYNKSFSQDPVNSYLGRDIPWYVAVKAGGYLQGCACGRVMSCEQQLCTVCADSSRD